MKPFAVVWTVESKSKSDRFRPKTSFRCLHVKATPLCIGFQCRLGPCWGGLPPLLWFKGLQSPCHVCQPHADVSGNSSRLMQLRGLTLGPSHAIQRLFLSCRASASVYVHCVYLCMQKAFFKCNYKAEIKSGVLSGWGIGYSRITEPVQNHRHIPVREADNLLLPSTFSSRACNAD